MPIVGRIIRQKQANDAAYARDLVALKRSQDMVEVPFERLTKQTEKAVLFPSYGWVPAVALRWRKADGAVVPWSVGRESDTLLMAREFVERRVSSYS